MITSTLASANGVLDLSEPKLHVREAALCSIRPGFPEHFMRHVHTNDPTCLSHGTGRKETIKACPAAEVKDGFPWP